MYPPIIKYNHAITDPALPKEYCENSICPTNGCEVTPGIAVIPEIKNREIFNTEYNNTGQYHILNPKIYIIATKI